MIWFEIESMTMIFIEIIKKWTLFNWNLNSLKNLMKIWKLVTNNWMTFMQMTR